ncbi:carboxyl transferase domain-containing protein [Streptomonospora nanhaiensis]|uniref:Acetyl-CoA carboxylase carboxyl transferase subunit beta n=1 Tax=Streptomonospora nanhaiensis TaxID=1323731 RepID=A0A853BXH9_9ACTN|nr:carboxyl transferase domain-containing protein [Streptomonospora nanhaiensis]MBV2364485.1 acetyl-CoA carboxyl transferase [Streptomonospora nanhaiensis]MBX9388022.1 acetyl-CoA carboxyl transferase [Streptomonospora nanhaiensis]NYI99167.1 acetyl-CoA carboxylase carboxyl transferase subunit beta [Streptomonospora nanhaiensis]
MASPRDHGRRLGARDLLAATLDPGSFRSWDTEPVDVRPDPAYAAELAAARERSGCDESVLTGEGRLRGRRVAVMVCEFRFLAGSIGIAAAERLVSAVERATAERLPLIAAPASGGTRMQEGTLAFLSMVKISAAIAAHKSAGLPYLVYLRHPTTGGVLASWGSQGHLTVAEPGALIGFLGPRVYEALYDRPFPEGVQTAENLYRRGLIDAVLEPADVPAIADRALNILLARPSGTPAGPGGAPLGADDPPVPDIPAWESITRSRRPDRPGVRKLLRRAAEDVVPLNGTGEGESDPGLLLALARFGDAPCVVLGQDRARQSMERPLGPAALREARRGMRVARELRLPLVTVIDTPGAALSKDAEERGMAGQIARCLAELVTLETPTLAVLLGQGTGGGALALAPADRVVAAQHAWLSPLPPEGASAIVHRTVDRAPDLAAAQGVRSRDLHANGVVDRVVPEHDDAADEPDAFCRRLGAVIRQELASLVTTDPATRTRSRHTRYRRLGLP